MRVAVAALFLSEGRQVLGEDEVIKAVSMKKRWFSPDLARKFIERAIGCGLMVREKGGLTPSFDYTEVDIPYNYYPDDSIFSEYVGEEDMPVDEKSAAELPMADYPFLDELKQVLYDMQNGKDLDDVRERLDRIEESLI